jgi:hypothetical protein
MSKRPENEQELLGALHRAFLASGAHLQMVQQFEFPEFCATEETSGSVSPGLDGMVRPTARACPLEMLDVLVRYLESAKADLFNGPLCPGNCKQPIECNAATTPLQRGCELSTKLFGKCMATRRSNLTDLSKLTKGIP